MANGPPSENPPLAQTSGYATDCGGAALFDSPRGGERLSNVGALYLQTFFLPAVTVFQ